MYNKTKSSLILTTIAILLFVFSDSQQVFSQRSPKVDTSNLGKLPKGNWSLSFHPYQEDDNSPVAIFSVSSKGVNVERFDIYNNSNSPVKAIKVKWLVHENQDRSKLLAEGVTSSLRFRDELASGTGGFITFRAVALANFYQSFLVDSKLDKDFDVDLAVDEVTFADGSVWRRADGKSPAINPDLASWMDAPTECAGQYCKGTPSKLIIGGTTYRCEASNNQERCVPSGDYSCQNQSCAQPGGGGGGIAIILD